MRYNVGDIVTVRSDLEVGQKYGADKFVSSMEDMLGKQVEIKHCDFSKGKYLIKESVYWWTDEMFESNTCEPVTLDERDLLSIL